MSNDKRIVKEIKEKLRTGNNKFAIFPFGKNGLLVDYILKQYFDIEALYIVDNEYCKYNRKIISLCDFREKFQEDTYVILTIENKEINRQLYLQLTEFVPREQILNLLEEGSVEPVRVDKQFELYSFLPYEKNAQKIEKEQQIKRIKVRIMYDDISTWNSIESICRAFQKDADVDFQIIIREGVYCDRMIESIKDQYLYNLLETYDVAEDKPDILFLIHPFADYKSIAFKFRKYTGMIVAAPMALVNYKNSVQECEKAYIEGIGTCRPDYYLFDTLLYSKLKNSSLGGGKIIEMGNAKFDGIYEACIQYSSSIPDKWEKLRNRKIVLWTTGHGIYGGKIDRGLTFDLYARAIFEYAQEHKEIGFIFRPHSSFVDELVKNDYWSLDDLDEVKRYIHETENMVWDENDTYNLAYAVADAIIVDGYCGMICSALPTMKPIGITYRNRMDSPLHPELSECYYKIYEESDLNHFFQNVVCGEKDEKYLKRKGTTYKCVKHFDGKNGQRICAFVKQEFRMMKG